MNAPPLPPSTEQQINEILSYKKRWDKVESGLRKLRDDFEIQGRIPQREKAEMLLHVEAGEDLLTVISSAYPQYLEGKISPSIQAKSGCAGIILLMLAPAFAFAGYQFFT